MEFLFECSSLYFTHSLSSLVRYQVEHEKRKFISPSSHVLVTDKKPTSFTFPKENDSQSFMAVNRASDVHF